MAVATGFEPVIFSVTGRRVGPGYTTRPLDAGGGNRTCDLGLMKALL